MIEIYGIKNCNSMKKAFDFMDKHSLSYTFIDFKKQTLDMRWLEEIERFIDMESLINKKGTTYKKLKDMKIDNECILQNLSIIKRPLIVIREDRGDSGIVRAFVGLDDMESLL